MLIGACGLGVCNRCQQPFGFFMDVETGLRLLDYGVRLILCQLPFSLASITNGRVQDGFNHVGREAQRLQKVGFPFVCAFGSNKSQSENVS